MTPTREQLAACIARRLSIPKTAAELGITEWDARVAALAFGLRWARSHRRCKGNHPDEALRIIAGRVRCGMCYDNQYPHATAKRAAAAAAKARASARSALPPKSPEKDMTAAESDRVLTALVRFELLPPWVRHFVPIDPRDIAPTRRATP